MDGLPSVEPMYGHDIITVISAAHIQNAPRMRIGRKSRVSIRPMPNENDRRRKPPSHPMSAMDHPTPR